MTAIRIVPNQETLSTKANRLARAMRESASGPLVVAIEVIDIAERWETLSHRNGLEVEAVLEPRLELKDIPPGAVFDPNGLNVPVALVLKLRKRPPVFPSCNNSEVSQP